MPAAPAPLGGSAAGWGSGSGGRASSSDSLRASAQVGGKWWVWTNARRGVGMAGTGTSPRRCWSTPFWLCPGATPPAATQKGGGESRRVDPTDGARDPAAAVPAAKAIPRERHAGFGVVSVETAPSGQGLAIPLQKTPAATSCLTAAVILDTAGTARPATNRAPKP